MLEGHKGGEEPDPQLLAGLRVVPDIRLQEDDLGVLLHELLVDLDHGVAVLAVLLVELDQDQPVAGLAEGRLEVQEGPAAPDVRDLGGHHVPGRPHGSEAVLGGLLLLRVLRRVGGEGVGGSGGGCGRLARPRRRRLLRRRDHGSWRWDEVYRLARSPVVGGSGGEGGHGGVSGVDVLLLLRRLGRVRAAAATHLPQIGGERRPRATERESDKDFSMDNYAFPLIFAEKTS